MKSKTALAALGVFFLWFMAAGSVFSQDQPLDNKMNLEGSVESDILWLWGEVSTVEAQNKTIAVKYFDYETDQEKEITVIADSKTIFDNLKSLDELKPLDTVSIDYIVQADGKNIAKNISLEKPEEAISLDTTVSPGQPPALAVPATQAQSAEVNNSAASTQPQETSPATDPAS